MQLNEQANQNGDGAHILRLHHSLFMRWLYFGVGILALLMGILGIFLPVLPTTPFILLAAACFARSSERFHDFLLNNRITGPLIYEWCKYRSISRQTKRWVYLIMALSFGSSILIVSSYWLKLMLILLAIILTALVWRIPVRGINIHSKIN
ncbi:YbaN family protein [Nitrosomonas sp. Is37]|uniref:YbaN family protein n=1 Tax=Nitrosomonas sp. Is37 TaxID=3080535 RepID=UPI00294B20D5|nr:YbaN family protein [Nitrosomonas sp. Is37]MDV6343001.1 YbaN family protein [Nitrosomonas sp. Is37]